MKKSTSFAQVANNLLNVLQGCSKSIRLLLVMFLTLIVTTNAWADTYSWTCSGTTVFSTSGSSLNGVTWKATTPGSSQGTGVSGEKCVQIAKNTGLTLETTGFNNKTISSISIQTWGSQGNTFYLKDGNTQLKTTTIPTSYTSNGAKISFSNVGVIETKLVFNWASASKAFNVRSITITYEDAAPSCTVKPTVGTTLQSVTVTENSINATIPISSIGGCDITENGLVYSTTNATPTADGSGCYKVTTTACGSIAANKTVTITGLNCGTSYYIRGYATNKAGTSYTNVTTKSTSDCPKYTVTWNVNGSVYETTQVTEGSKPTFPATPSSCDATSNTFYGWATAIWDGKIDNISEKTIYTSANDMPAVNGAVTYYAVFAKTSEDSSGDYKLVTSLSNLKSGVAYLGSQISYSGVRYYYMSSTAISSNLLSISNATVSSNILQTPNSEGKINLVSTGTANQYYIKNAEGKYLYSNAAGSLSWSTTACSWTFSNMNSTTGLAELTSSANSNIKLRAYGTSTTQGKLKTYSGTTNYGICVFLAEATTTYSDYITTCTEPSTFNITYNTNGGSPIAATSGTTLPDPLPPTTKSGYTFAGWYTDEECTQEATAGAEITQNTTLHAKWTANTYTVCFNANGGTGTMGNQSFTYGAEQALSSNKFTLDSYIFAGWATTEDGDVVYTDAQSVSNLTTTNGATITLYAQWTQLHTITWMVGSTSILTEEVANATGVTKTPANPANGAIGNCANAFMGWSETPLGSAGGQSAPADLCTAAQMKAKYTSVTDDKTFYAVFASAEGGNDYVQISSENDLVAGSKYLIVGNSSSTYRALPVDKATSLTYVYPSSSKISNPAGELIWTLEGTADQWKIKSTSNNKYLQISGGNLTFVESTALTFAVTVSSSKFTFTSSASSGNKILSYYHSGNCFNAFSSANTVYIYKQDVSYSNYVTNCCNTPAPTNGTYTSPSGTSVTLTWDGESTRYHITGNGLDDYTDDESYTVTGLTECNEYTFYISAHPAEGCESAAIQISAQPFSGAKTVTFNPNGGAVSPTSETTSCTNQSIKLPPTPTYSGYRFMGWFTAANGGTEITGTSYTPTADITLFAHWEKEYTVTYDANGGSTTCANGNYIEGEIVTLCTNTPSKSGYTFAGWTYSPNVTITDGKFVMPASDVTITAQWTINQYTVTWNPNGGNWAGSTENIVHTYDYGATINRPADPTRENGIFTGWYPEPASTMPASDKTYEAQWDMVYTLTFVDMNAGGTTSTLTQTSSGQNIVAPTANSEVCDMWTFIGWAPSNSLNGGTDKPAGFIAAGEPIPGSQITENKTYYSVYSYNSDNTQEFEVGKSGTYLMYAISGTTKYYATTARTGGFYGNQETSFATYGPSKFTLTYNKAENKYIIYHENTTSDKESSGYFELNTSDGNVDVKSETPSLFTIQAGSNGAFIIRTDYTNSSGNFKERSFGYGGNFTDYEGDNPIYFEPASEIQYYNAANCGEVDTYTMSFHNPFGDKDALIWYDAEHEDPYYTGKPLNTSIEVFPTMTYNGWAFIGWTANEQYNDWIGDENLDDENSAADDPASSFTIYNNTAGWAYKLTSDVTMYPVFTKYDDNEDVDLVNGGEFYMYFYREGDYYKDDYFGADNHYQRMYALAGGGDNGEFGFTTNCNNAQIFEFIKEGDGWNIRVKNADGTYPTKSYLVNTSENDYDLVSTKPSYKWSITKEPEGDYTMWYKGNATNQTTPGYYVAKAREYSGGTSWTFKCYNQDNDASQYYYKVYLGTCENRVFSSNPSNKPVITLSGTPQVTSTRDQSIRAQGELSISATKLAANGTITLTSDNADVYFSTVKDANFTQATKPVTPLTLIADEKGKLAMTTVYVHYKPTSTSSLGVQTANITATTGTDGQPDYATATTTATVRNLPADFVIAAKWGDNWYAMPANMNSQSSTEGWLIEVDDAANPTKALAAPNTTKYGLKSVYTSNSNLDRYADNGERLVFVENIEETTPVTNKTLYNGGDASSSKTNIQVYAQYANYYSENPNRYEWIPTTTDLTDYTLTSGAILTGDAVGRTVSLDNHGNFGTLLQDKSYNGMVRLLPVDNFYGPAELQVVEWKQNSVSVMYTGAGTKYTTKVGDNAESSVQALSSIDHAVYSLATTDLTAATNQPLIITIKDDAEETIGVIKLTIPAIVAVDKTTTALGVTEENAEATSIVVLDGATLKADATKYTYDDVVVYPGGKLVIGKSGKLGMYTLTLRLGSSWGAAEYEYKYPQFVLNTTTDGAYSNTSGQINLDYVTTKDQYYTFVAPFEVKTKDIKYPIDIYGTNVATNNSGSFEFEYYDGAERAAGNTGWKTVAEDPETGADLTPGQGYTFLGMPKKVSVNGATSTRQTYGIHRIPMKVAASVAQTHENTDQTVPLAVTLAEKDNDSGWNIVGNPYMSNVEGLTNNDIQVGELVHTNDVNGNWTGKWHWDNPTTGQRFLVIPRPDGQSYDAVQASNATLHAFKHFFVQIHNEDANAMSIPVANRVDRNLAPARYAQAEIEKDIEIAVQMTGDKLNDQMDFLINDIYSTAFEKNADFTKMMNATNFNIYGVHVDNNLSFVALDKAAAMQSVAIGFQVPKAGEYQLSLSDKPYVMADKIEALFVTDHEASPEVTTNLVDEDYTFYVNQAQTNNTRFTVSIILKPEKENTPTGVDNINTKGKQPIKFLYQDKIYILRNGMIYDTTGKQVITINK